MVGFVIDYRETDQGLLAVVVLQLLAILTEEKLQMGSVICSHLLISVLPRHIYIQISMSSKS
jgi:hypothetical protein